MTVAGLVAVAGVAGFALMAFVFSIGTAVVPVKVEARVFDRETRAPVAHCLLAFEKGGVGLSRPATIDYGQTRGRTDGSGGLVHESSYSHVGSMFWPFDRERRPELRFYLGEAPRYGSSDVIESWHITLRFDEPWTRAEVSPVIDVQRSLAHEESRTRSGGFEPLPSGPDPVDRLVRASVRFEPGGDGRESYRVPLSLFLAREQIEACQATTLAEVESAAVDRFNSGHYAEALDAYREVARRTPDSSWAHRGAGHSLSHLGRHREATEAFRRAAELAPKDAETLYWYANSLVEGRQKEAVEQFRRLVAIEPDNARGWIGLANALYDLDRFAETVEAFAKAVRLCGDCLNENDRAIYEDSKRLVRLR